MEMNRNRLDTCIDWVLCAVTVICLVMMGFSAGCGDWLLSVSFTVNLVCVTVSLISRDGDER